MNADEVVKALRDWSEQYLSVMCASDCAPQCYEYCDGVDCIAVRAADCIESLQAQLAAYKATDLSAAEIFQMRREWRDTEKHLRENAMRLITKLEASQRRADAAVGDMKLIVDAVREEYCDETCCFACAFDCDTSINDSGVPNCECPGFERDDCFEWRGPQEARKGE